METTCILIASNSFHLSCYFSFILWVIFFFDQLAFVRGDNSSEHVVPVYVEDRLSGEDTVTRFLFLIDEIT